MKVLLIHDSFIEPLGCLYLMGAMGQDVEVKLMRLPNPNYDQGWHEQEDIRKLCEAWLPGFIGYSCTTGNHKRMLSLNAVLRQYFSFTSIFGGPHVTFFPEIANEEGVDLICRGEGEHAFSDMINGVFPFGDVHIISDHLNQLPFPARPYLSPITYMIASRGCPFSCSYCYNSKWKEMGGTLRYRSVDNVIAELNSLKVEPKLVYFQDDTFGWNQKWLEEFAAKWPKVPFHCHIRPEYAAHKIDLLKRAGCTGVHMGIEAGNEDVRSGWLNRNHTTGRIIDTARKLKDAGIPFMAQNMVGIDGDILHDLETLELNIRVQPDYAWCSIFQPYPGTKLGDEIIEKYDMRPDDFPDSFYDGSILPFDETYKARIKALATWFDVFVQLQTIPSMDVLDIFAEIKDKYTMDMRDSIRRQGHKKVYGMVVEGRYGESRIALDAARRVREEGGH